MNKALYVFLIMLSLNLDCFTVSLTEGLVLKSSSNKRFSIIGLVFGLFHSIFFLAGYLLGDLSSSIIQTFDHWVAFLLLLVIGVHMIVEDIRSIKPEYAGFSKDPKMLIGVASAVSIDALAIGVVSYILIKQWILFTFIFFLLTFTISFTGLFVGSRFSFRFKKLRFTQTAGGIILLLIGFRILIDHLV